MWVCTSDSGNKHSLVTEFRCTITLGLDHALLCVECFVLNMLCDMCGDLCE